MASNEDSEFSPSKKRLKLETIDNDEVPHKVDADNDDDDDDDESTILSPNNLEHLPIEILMHIFTYTDDIGLLNLAINSSRFEKIGKVVFTDRYADKYFTIDNESKRQQEIYEELFSRFGSGVHAIKVIDIHGIDKNHWLAQMIHKHIGNRLQKLEFRNCTFKNECDMLANHLDITHLTITCGELNQEAPHLNLPNYRNLRKLEVRNVFICTFSLEWIFRHNVQLESLSLCDAYFPLAKLMKYVAKYVRHLKEFIVMDDVDVGEEFPSHENIEKFLNVTHDLESLGITIHTKSLDLYRRLSLNCGQNIKRLELFIDDLFEDVHKIKMNQMIEITRSFKNVEMLSMTMVCDKKAPILSIIENLPKLRHLYIVQVGENLTEWVFDVLQKCEHLDKLVIVIDSMSRPEFSPNIHEQADGFYHHINAHFHSEIWNLKRNPPNFEIKFLDKGQTIGRVTENEIVWRNKLVHWIGFDPIYSKSKVNLLDLAEQTDHRIQQSSSSSTSNQGSDSQNEYRNPFDLVLDYLDLNSLYALHECSIRSKQLVDDYVRRHSEQAKTFFITDEFYLNCDGMKQFAPYVTNLNIKFLDEYLPTIMVDDIIEKYYKNLTKLCVHAHCRIDPDEFIFSNVKHYTFYGYRTDTIYFCNFFRLAKKCKHLKKLEIKTAMKLSVPRKIDDGRRPTFSNLQTLKFKPKNEAQIKLVRKLFAKNGTEIVILD